MPTKKKSGKKSKAPPPPKITTSVVIASSSGICRGPLFEGYLRYLCKLWGIDNAVTILSCSLSNSNLGELPHLEAQECARKHGLNISSNRARLILKEDFKYALVIAMDSYDLELYQKAKEKFNYENGPEVKLLSDFIIGEEGKSLPDCYYEPSISEALENVYQKFIKATPGIELYLKNKLK